MECHNWRSFKNLSGRLKISEKKTPIHITALTQTGVRELHVSGIASTKT